MSMSNPTNCPVVSLYDSNGGKGAFVPTVSLARAGAIRELTPIPPRNAMIATMITVTMKTVLPTPPLTASGGGAPGCAMTPR